MTNFASECLLNIGPMSSVSPTFENAGLVILDPLTFSAGAYPASPPVSRADEREALMIDGYGPNLFESAIPYDRLGYSLRTRAAFLACLMRKGCFANWKALVTNSGRLYYRLLMSERRIEGSGSGLLGDWRTPHGMDNAHNPRRNGPSGNELGRQVNQWGTPRVTSNGGHGKDRADNKSRLEDQVHEWPTPQSRDFRSGKASQETADSNSRPLNEAVLLWPTPRSRDAHPESEQAGLNHQEKWSSMTLPTLAGLQDRESRNTTGKPQDWPTPIAGTSGSNQGGGSGRTGPVRPNLSMAAKQWPTPTREDSECTGRRPATESRPQSDTLTSAARDWPTPQNHDHKQGDASRVGRYGKKAGGRNLNDEAVMDWQTPSVADTMGGHLSCGGERATELLLKGQIKRNPGKESKGSLNPDWVSQLQGFPADWLHLEDEQP